jgi:hypothetical protein
MLVVRELTPVQRNRIGAFVADAKPTVIGG